MATIYLPNGTTIECKSSFFKDVFNAINEDYIEDITDEIDCYDLEEDEKTLVEEHPNADFYLAFDDCMSWKQPKYVFAVE